MASFEVFGKFAIKKPVVTVESAVQIIKGSLSRHYNANKIRTTSNGLTLKGNLKAFAAQAVTNAVVRVEIVGGELTYRVDGSASLGVWPWVFFGLAFVSSVLWGYWGFFLIWFLCEVVSYFICRDKPKQYFEDAFKAVQFELG